MDNQIEISDLFLEGTAEREVLESVLMKVEEIPNEYATGCADLLRWLLGVDEDFEFKVDLESTIGGVDWRME